MSHIAEVYAKDLGVKIGKPQIAEHFYPGLPEEYITFQASNKMKAKDYANWDIVISLIKPHLGDTKIVQVGGPDDPQVPGVDQRTAGSSYRQMNHIIKNGNLHFGVDSLPMHVASVYDRPIVALFGNIYKENAYPLWNKKNPVKLLEPDWSKAKPSFGTECERINEIKPEDVAQSILDGLKIDAQIKFKTVRAGKTFRKDVVEVVPNFFGHSAELSGKPINLRGDLEHNENNIVAWCRACLVSLTLSEPLSIEALQHCTNLKQVIFKYRKEYNSQDLSGFFKILKRNKVSFVILVEDEEIITDVRLKYLDYNVISEPEPCSDEVKPSKYLSRKRFITNGEVYSSEFSANRLDKSNNFVYDEASSKELESLYLYDEE